MRLESTTARQLRLDKRNHAVMPLLNQRSGINWLEDNQVEEGGKQLSGEQRVTRLLESLEPN